MAFENYKGSIKLGAGLTPAAEGFPLMQTSDIQAAEDGTRLDECLASMLPKAELNTAIDSALATAKASGEFNGADGLDGIFIGTQSAYEKAYAEGLIPVGCIVIIDEASTTAILGRAVLGKMVLGTI